MASSGSGLIGLLGGMSWESSALYYSLINREAQRRQGGHRNARSILFTLDYHQLDTLASEGDWEGVGVIVAEAARRIEAAGAEIVLITAVTAHAVAAQVQQAINVPLLHIGDPVGEAMVRDGFVRVAVIGTRYTMEMGHFAARLAERHGLEAIVPPAEDRARLHEIIVDELTLGRASETSREAVVEIVAALRDRGAEAVAVACTELPLLMAMERYPLPAYDASRLHAEAAVALALRPAVG